MLVVVEIFVAGGSVVDGFKDDSSAVNAVFEISSVVV